MLNLDTMSLQELMELQKQLPPLIAQRQEEVRKDIVQKASSLAAKHGLTLEDVMRKGRKRQSVKYVNPADPMQTWSGVGSRPKWVRDLLATGKTLYDIRSKEGLL